MESWTAGQYLLLPESGTRLPRFLTSPDPGGGPLQTLVCRRSQQNGVRRGAAVGTLTVADNARKRREEGADSRDDVIN